jgi:hypothetical protein
MILFAAIKAAERFDGEDQMFPAAGAGAFHALCGVFRNYELQDGDRTMRSAMDGAKARKGKFEHSFRILDEQESYRLEALYCALDAGGRRRRFCAVVSDASIRVHCEGLASRGAVVIGAFQSGRMDAAIEIVPFSDLWDEAEIAVTSFRRNSGALVTMLLVLAAEEARQRGCDRLVTVLDADADLLPLLAGLGEVEIDLDIARIDISEPGRASLSPLGRKQRSLATVVWSYEGFQATSVSNPI